MAWLWVELRYTATFLLIGVLAEVTAFLYWANGAIASSESDINLSGVFAAHGRQRLISFVVTFILFSGVRLACLAMQDRNRE